MASYQPPPPASSASSNNGTIVLVLGILSIVVCGILGPVAWIMGNNTLKTMDQMGGGDPSARSQVNIGRICGIIGTVFMVLGILYFMIAGATILSAFRNAPRPGTSQPTPGPAGPTFPAPTTPGPTAPTPTTPGPTAPVPDSQAPATPPAQPGGM